MADKSSKLKLIFEVDGVQYAVQGMEKVDAAATKMGQGVESATGRMEKSAVATGRMAQDVQASAGRMAESHKVYVGRMDETTAATGRMATSVSASTGRMAAEHSRNMGTIAASTRSAQGGMTAFEKGLWDLQMRLMNIGMAVGIVVAGLYGLSKAADTQTQIASRIKLVTDNSNELAAVQERLFDLSQDTRSANLSTVEIYARMARSSKELELSQQDLLRITESINKSVVVSGGSAASAEAALVQLGQAFASGALRGEELNSVMEQAPRLAEAIAKGMGKTIGELRKMGEEGELTAEAVAQALLSQSDAIDRDFDKMSKTVEQSFIVMKNSFGRYIGSVDQAYGLSARLADGIIFLSDHVEDLGAAVAVIGSIIQGLGIGDQILLIKGLGQATGELIDFLGQVPGLLTPLAVGAYYAVGGVAALSAAFTGLTAAIAASMAVNPAAWAAGIGVAFYMAAKPAVSALDELIHKYTELNLTGEAAYREELKRAAEADKAWEFQKQKSLFMYKEGGVPLSAGMKKELGIDTTPSAPPTEDIDAYNEAIKRQNEYVREYNRLQDERIQLQIQETPGLTDLEKALWGVGERFKWLITLYPEHRAELQRNHQLHIQNITNLHNLKQAIKDTSDQFRDYLRVAESETPQHNPAGEMNLRWEEELKWVQSLQPTAEIDKLNIDLETLQKMLDQGAGSADKLKAAMQTLQQQLRAGVDYKLEDLQIAGIKDPYEQQIAFMEARYSREKQLIKENLKYMKEGSSEQIKAIKTLNQLDINETRDTANIKWSLWRDSLGFYSDILGQMANAMDTSSRSGFESSKLFAMGSAVMNTAASVMAQTAGPDGWTPAAWGRAVAVGLMGAWQVAKIASTNYGGGGSVGGVSAGYISGTGGSGSVGSSIGGPTRSIHDTQTQDSLQQLAAAADNASLAIGRVADGLTSIADLFGEGTRGSMVAGTLPSSAIERNSVSANTLIDPSASAKQLFSSWSGGWKMAMAFDPVTRGLFGGGTHETGLGLSLGIEGGQLDAMGYRDWARKGGLFRSGKSGTNYFGVDSGVTDSLDADLQKIIATVIRSAVAMGTTADISAANLPATKIQTSGRSAEDIAKDLEAWYTKAADAIGQTVQGLEQFTFYGESAFNSAIRLATSLQGVNENLDMIGARLIDSTLRGANAAYQLVELMGGLENMQDSVATYFESMFSDEEQERRRAAAAAREVSVAFAEMNLSVPATKAGFISIVDSLNLSTERGRALFASLMDVSEAFALVQDYTAELAEQQRESTRDIESRYLRVTGKGTMADLLDLVNQQQDEYEDYVRRGLDTSKLLQVQQLEYAEAAKEAAETLSQASTELTIAADNLRDKLSAAVAAQINIMETLKNVLGGDLSTLSPEAKYQQSGSAFRATFGRAKLGDVDAMQQVSALAQTFLQSSRSYNASGPGYASDFAEVTQALALLGGLPSDTQIQIDVAQQQLENLKKIQESIVDGNIESASYLKGILGENSGVTVLLEQYLQADAEARLAVLRAQQEAQERALFEQQKATDILNAKQTYEQALATIQSQAQSSMDDAVKAQQLSNSGQYDARYDIAPVVDNISYQPNPNGIVDANDVVLFLHRHTDVYISKMEEYARSIYEAALAGINSRTFVPQYAVGGFALPGWALVGEEGPELVNFSAPGRVYTATETRAAIAGDNGETVAELKNAVTELRALVRLQGEANRQLIAKLAAVEARLAGAQTKAILENAA